MAKADGRSTDELLALYALDGFLDRLSTSSSADDRVLKDGVLLVAYDTRRPTRHIDLQATHLAGDADTVLALVRDIAASHKDDGLVLDAGSATARVIRDEEEYSGAASIHVVATHRSATLTPLDEALAGYAEIAQNKWSAWVRKQRLPDRLDQDFAGVLQDVLTFAGPAVSGAIKGRKWVHRVGRWMP